MNDLIWDNTLSVQIDEIDEDHRRLVDLFNLLNHAVSENESSEYIDALMAELVSCTDWHFKHEERLMLKYAFPGFAEHKAEHEELLNSVRQMEQKRQASGKDISNDEILFLEHWLTGHILGLDMDLGEYLSEVI